MMATMNDLQDFNSVNNQLQGIVLQPQQKNTVADGISSVISNTMNSIPHVMSEQRKNFEFQFQEVIGCLNLMEKQGIIKINRDEEVIEVVDDKPTVKEVAIAVGIIFAVIKIGLLIL